MTDATPVPPSGELAQAVHAFFDRSEKTLPHYVSATPSMMVAMSATLAVFLQGGITVRADQLQNKDSLDPMKKFRWVIMLAVLLGVCNTLYDFVQEKAYNVAMITMNKQHIANLHWLRQYRKSVA